MNDISVNKIPNFNDLSISEKKAYYEQLRKECVEFKNAQANIGQGLIKTIYPFLRKYQIELQGEENIPKDTRVLFVANHSNSHDIFTAYEMFSFLERQGSVMVATDCLSPITTQIFNISNATLLDRRVPRERQDSVLSMSKKILTGNDGLIFGEGTWNLHPTLPMHNIHNGAAKVSLITEAPIIPTIIEYIEKEEMISSDSQLFDKCIIRFGKPIVIDCSDTLSTQSAKIREAMATTRKQIWCDYDIKKNRIEDINPCMYINHTYAKKFKALGFTYDSKKEQNHLLFLNDEPEENEYTLNQDSCFVPGITEKKTELRKILK
ncbi:MAG: lysophospholipid acyltransferase family protein [bacterium]|nr:lysophospholipid acyltransferase family protein [bacterium]